MDYPYNLGKTEPTVEGLQSQRVYVYFSISCPCLTFNTNSCLVKLWQCIWYKYSWMDPLLRKHAWDEMNRNIINFYMSPLNLICLQQNCENFFMSLSIPLQCQCQSLKNRGLYSWVELKRIVLPLLPRLTKFFFAERVTTPYIL